MDPTKETAPGRYTRDEVVGLIDQINKAAYEPHRWYWPFSRRRGCILKVVIDGKEIGTISEVEDALEHLKARSLENHQRRHGHDKPQARRLPQP